MGVGGGGREIPFWREIPLWKETPQTETPLWKETFWY